MRLPKTKRGRTILSLVVAGELVSAALAWRDLARRTDAQVRGSKKLWRLIVTLNPGNSLAYWLFGRR